MINTQSPIMQQQYFYNPATRFQSSFMGNNNQGYAGNFGTLGYNPNVPNYSGYNTGYNNGGYIYQAGIYPQYQGYGQGLYNPYQYQQERTYTIEGFNPLNMDALMTSDIENQMDELAKRMYQEQEESMYRQRELMSANPYNYYGYMNIGSYSSNMYRLRKQQEELYQQAVENKMSFMKKLSRGARRYLGMECDEEEINEIYDSRVYTIPQQEIIDQRMTYKLATFTADYGEITRNQVLEADNKITEEHNKVVSKDADLNTFLNQAGRMLYDIEMEEIEKQRRNKQNLYKTSDYSRYLDEQIYKRDRGIKVPPSLFPALSANSSFLDDGTLQIRYPEYLKNAKNESEKNYDLDRQRFLAAISNSH